MPRSVDELFKSFEHEAKSLQSTARQMIERESGGDGADEVSQQPLPAVASSPPLLTPRSAPLPVSSGLTAFSNWTWWIVAAVTILLFSYFVYRYMRSRKSGSKEPGAQTKMVDHESDTAATVPQFVQPRPRSPRTETIVQRSSASASRVDAFLDTMKAEHEKRSAMQKRALEEEQAQRDEEDEEEEDQPPPPKQSAYVSSSA